MLARSTLAIRAQAPLGGVRNMATLREIELRLKSVRNIEKITKSMKMIASTKLSKAQRAMTVAKAYGASNNGQFPTTLLPQPPPNSPAQIRPATELFKHAEPTPESASASPRKLFVVISSDKGLCGGIHSSVSKGTRRLLATGSIAQDGKPGSANAPPSDAAPASVPAADSPLVVIGDKSKAQLSRALPNNLVLTMNQIGKDIPTFADAASVADLIKQSGVEYDSVVIVYNRYLSAVAFEAAAVEVLNEKGLREAPGFNAYEQEDDTTKDLAEFTLANAIFAALTESHAAEQNSRRNAMDNASKNAGDMIGTLQMQYNRGRQAAITNELVDIITGASAL
ncbi:ATP synthase F1 gamma [Hysterangium stoloniferum]|nr:ATP synthase F1 gamma [Hysterangium stoloniferum]